LLKPAALKILLLVCALSIPAFAASPAPTPSPTPSPNDVEGDFFVDDPGQQSVPPPATPAQSQTQSPPTTPDKPKLNYTEKGSGESHPFFDWSQHQGETLVPHPLADQGLVEVTKDRVYVYNIPQSDQHYAGTFLFDFEWQKWRLPVGKLGLIAGAGMYFAQGHGHFTKPELNPGLTPEETFSLVVIPINIGAIYRMQFWDRQLFVPFGGGGGTLIPFTELRDDGYGPRFAGSVAAYLSAGVAFNLTYFDKLSAIVLDREYGINRMYLMAELREMINLDPHYDFGGTIINGGFTAEF
jgi:hypothetical protein